MGIAEGAVLGAGSGIEAGLENVQAEISMQRSSPELSRRVMY
jgi:hypothetical protein